MKNLKICPYGVEGYSFKYDRETDRITVPGLGIKGTGFLLSNSSGNFFFKADDGRYFVVRNFFNSRYSPYHLEEIDRKTILEVLAWAMQGQSLPQWLQVSVASEEVEEASKKLLSGELHAIYETKEHYNPWQGEVVKAEKRR